jgi:hypothetical protein
MIPNTSYNVANVQVSALPIGVTQIEGYFNGGANAWLQVFDSCVAPAVGAIPTYQLLLNSTAQFQETLQISQIHFYEGVFVGVSSTEGTYTASALAMDITVFTDQKVLSTNAVGDKTTSVTSQQVWSEATGAASNKKLYQLIVTEKDGVNSFILIYADDTPSNVNPGLVFAQYSLAANATVKLLFGDGLRPFDQYLPSTASTSTTRQGCTVLIGYTIGVANPNGVTKYGAVTSGVPGVGSPGTATHATILAITN